MQLALAMAEVLFGGQARGRPKGVKTWTENRYLHLGFAYYRIKHEHPRKSDTKIAAILGKHPDFKGDPENIRQRLGEAKRQYNLWAEHEAEDYIDEDAYDAWREAQEAGWDDD
jgi:hypothetical protein